MNEQVESMNLAWRMIIRLSSHKENRRLPEQPPVE
jgi:hypothetical protein